MRLILVLVLLLAGGLSAWADPASPAGAARPDPGAPLTLAEAADAAVRLHPDLDAAASRVLQARARADAARAGFYPTLSANVGATHSESSGGRTSGLNVVRSGGATSYVTGVSGRQTVFDFGRRRSRARAADRNLEATQEELEGTLQDLLLEVAVSYFTVLREESSVLIQRDNVRDAEERLRQARGFYEAGTRARVEVTRAEADLAGARLSLIQAENAEMKARVLLGTAMGLPASVEVALARVSLPARVPTMEGAVALAGDFRPDVRASRERLDAAVARVNLAAAEYRPTVDARGSYQVSDTEFPQKQNNWNLGMDISIPLFNEPTLGSALREAEAARAEQDALLESLMLKVRRQVGENLLDVQEARERQEAATVGVRSAEDNFSLASERYRVGVGSPIEVSEAQRLLVAARSQLSQAGFDLEVALARLHRSMGTLTLPLLAGQDSLPPAPGGEGAVQP